MTLRARVVVACSLGWLFVASGCRNAPGERPAGPGEATSASDRDEARSPSGAGSGTGGATPSASRDAAGSSSNNPVQAREYAGTPGTTAQKPEPGTSPSGASCQSDNDCALSRFIPGQCCQDCEERAVTRTELEETEARCADALAKCPVRACAPSRRTAVARCVAGVCQAQPGTAQQ